MKKAIIGSLVGAIIIFIWQFLSFAAVNFHKSAQQYTDKQQAIMDFLKTQNLDDGGYLMPAVPEGTSNTEMQQKMKEYDGQPRAVIQYHNKFETSTNAMIMNMIRGFLVDFVMVLLFCWLIGKMVTPGFGTILTSALIVGLIAFLFEPYTENIWYKFFDIWAYFFDAIAAWGLTGLWLGWWLRRGRIQMNTVKIPEREKELA